MPARQSPLFQSVIFDCDSTLSAIEGIDELAGELRPWVSALTNAAMRGEIPLQDVYSSRMEKIRPTRAQIEQLGELYVAHMVDEAAEVCRELQAAGIEVYVLSGGLLPAVLTLTRTLGIPDSNVAAVDIYFDDSGNYTGFESNSPLAQSGGKLIALLKWQRRLARPAMLVGDGTTDLEARSAVDMFVAYAGVAARENVMRGADAVVPIRSLAPVFSLAVGHAALRHSGDELRTLGSILLPPQIMYAYTNGEQMSDKQPWGRFFLPGPTEVHDDVMQAQTKPMLGHRSQPMEDLVEKMERNLRTVFRTERPVFICAASATGMMEAGIRNGVLKKVLCLVNGAFSDRFYHIAEACGVTAVPLKVAEGEYHSPEMVREALAGDDYDAVTVVHSETSTGVLNPIRELAAVVHEREDRLILVDSVSGLGGAQVESDAWQLDYILTGSQKALAVPPGLALGVAQNSLMARAKKIPFRGIYFDFVEFDKYIRKNQTPSTPALSLMYALDTQLERMVAETMEVRWERHLQMRRRTEDWVLELQKDGIPVSIFAPSGYRSPTVTCVTMPPGKPGSEVTRAMAARGYTISAGYGGLKDKTIRIGHMGDHTVAELDALLGVLTEVMKS